MGTGALPEHSDALARYKANFEVAAASSAGLLAALTNRGIAPLGSATGINLKATGDTLLYTVPAGSTAYIERLVLYVTAVDTFSVAAEVKLKNNSGDIIAATTLTGFNAVGESWEFVVTGVGLPSTAGQLIELEVTTGATATTLTGSAYLYGRLQ